MSTGSLARVSADRPGRYGKQLASHLSRRLQAAWDETESRGHVSFQGEEFSGGLIGELTMIATDDTLLLQLETGAEHVEQLEAVIGRHLVGFGKKGGLMVSWERDNGVPGTSYTIEDLPEKMKRGQ